MSPVLTVTVSGLKLQTLNLREHHHARARRVRDERLMVFLALREVAPDLRAALRSAPAVAVRFTRIGGRALDSDNAVGAAKGVRDEVAKWLGKSDAPGSGLEWVMPVVQEPGRVYAVRIEFTVVETEVRAAG